jgi:Ca2+-binding RTX toxin-like protein
VRSSALAYGVAALVVAALLCMPAVATAGRIDRGTENLKYTGGDGEANVLTISHDDQGYRFADSGRGAGGAAITVTGSCGLSVSVAVCNVAVTAIIVNLADGEDQLVVDASVSSAVPVVANGGDGTDSLTGGAGSDSLVGGSGDDALNGRWGNDLLDSGSTADAEGSDTLLGGDGADTVDYSGRSAPLAVDLDGTKNDGEAGERDDVEPDVEHVIGGSGRDTITGSDDSELLEGGNGDDRILGSGGDDTLIGGIGEDDIDGGAGDDGIAGEPGEDQLTGGVGDDSISGGSGSDSLGGGSGNDSLDGGAGADAIAGDDGNDFLTGAGPAITGADAADDMNGGPGADVLQGAAGNDTLDGGPGPDELRGSAGRDTATYENRSARVVVTLDGVANDGEPGENDNVFADVEVVLGGTDWNTIEGDADANTLTGGPTEDLITGLGAGDRLLGGDGSDLLRARDGVTDDVDCGGDNDLALADLGDTVRACEWVDVRERRRLIVGRSALVQPQQPFGLRLPGARRDYTLQESVQIPLGSRIDPQVGVVELATARNKAGSRQQVSVSGDPVTIRQSGRRNPVTVLTLAGGHPEACRASAAGGRRKPPPKRKRESTVKVDPNKPGRTRVQGDYSDAVAEGTEWTTTDRCDGTLTRVISGTVSVTDRTRHKKIRVHAGDSHLARARR